MPKRYPEEFRRKVLDLVAAGRPVAQIAAELKRLKRENAELKRANAILKAASAFFAAELCATTPVMGGKRLREGGTCRDCQTVRAR